MRRRRHGLVRFEAQDWIRQSAHLKKLRKNHMVQAWVLGLSWMTGPVERLWWIGVSRCAVIVFNLRV